MGIFKKTEVTTKPDPPRVVSDYDKKWMRFSYDRWRHHYDSMLLSIEIGDQSETQTNILIRRSADAADEALRLEELRWGRAVLDSEVISPEKR